MHAFNLPAMPAPADAIFVSKKVGCVRLDLFGVLSEGIARDSVRVTVMRGPGFGESDFFKTATEAAAYMFGLVIEEIHSQEFRDLRADFGHSREVFSPYAIRGFGRDPVGPLCLSLAFEWAAGRKSDCGNNHHDAEFMAALWDGLCDLFFAADVTV